MVKYLKYGLWITLILLLPAQIVLAQLIKVEAAGSGQPSSHLLQPGVYLQPRNTEGYDQHTKTNIQYNCLRTTAIEQKLRQSDSLSHFLNSLDNLKSDFQQYYESRTDKFIVQINRMPAWLSSSSDTTEVANGFKAYEGHPPDSFSTWDSLVRGMTNKLKSWGIHPYYEVWNAPDTFNWQSTTDSFLLLYKHTAQAIKQTDTLAKVGGPAVHKWPNGKNCDAFQVDGHRPDSLIDSCALIKTLVDSMTDWGVPLEFISWKLFATTVEEIPLAARYFHRLLQAKGVDSTTEVILTGWNLPRNKRETLEHPGLFAKTLTYLSEVDTIIDAYAVSAWQDGQHNDSLEFYQGSGMISDGGLQKPAWKSLVFGHMLRKGQYVPISTKDRVITIGSIFEDTMRVLIANTILSPFSEAYIDLLYQHEFNEKDLAQAGYTSDQELDSVFRELKPPAGPQSLIDAFDDAIDTYAWTDSVSGLQRDFQLQILNNTNLGGFEYRLDTAQNNMIYKYDSFRSVGYNRQQAVNLVYFRQALSRRSIQMNNALYEFSLPPNGMVLLEFSNVKTGIRERELPEGPVTLFPNPAHDRVTVRFDHDVDTPLRVELYNLVGEQVATLHKVSVLSNHKVVIPLRDLDLNSGLYIVKIKKDRRVYTKKLLITPVH